MRIYRVLKLKDETSDIDLGGLSSQSWTTELSGTKVENLAMAKASSSEVVIAVMAEVDNQSVDWPGTRALQEDSDWSTAIRLFPGAEVRIDGLKRLFVSKEGLQLIDFVHPALDTETVRRTPGR